MIEILDRVKYESNVPELISPREGLRGDLLSRGHPLPGTYHHYPPSVAPYFVPKQFLGSISKEPSHLHIVLSGTCTVTKYPDRLAAVQRKISEIGAALDHIKSKYTYHREVRTKIVSESTRNRKDPTKDADQGLILLLLIVGRTKFIFHQTPFINSSIEPVC